MQIQLLKKRGRNSYHEIEVIYSLSCDQQVNINNNI